MIVLINDKAFNFPEDRINITRKPIDCSSLSDDVIMTTVPGPPDKEINYARDFYQCKTKDCLRLSTQESFKYCYKCYLDKVKSGEIAPFLLPSLSKCMYNTMKNDPTIKSCEINHKGILSINV
jgi:hypothetical protein